MKICLVATGETEGQTNVTKLKVAFSDFSNAPKMIGLQNINTKNAVSLSFSTSEMVKMLLFLQFLISQLFLHFG
jgi:hypothetical protein